MAATKGMVVKAELVKGVASGKAAILLTTPAEDVTGVVEAVDAVVMDVILFCKGKMIVPGWAPLLPKDSRVSLKLLLGRESVSRKGG